jgi:hypothetical protein
MIAQFSLRLICGMSLMWAVMPRSPVASGFFRIQMLVALGLAVLAALTMGRLSPERSASAVLIPHWAAAAACILLAVLSFLGSVLWTLERRRAGAVAGFAIAAVSGSLLILTLSPLPGGATGALAVPSELSSAALLGAATTGMLLGHWYLTAPTMSIAPLSRLTLFFAGAALARLALSSLGLALAWNELTGNVYWMWLSLRWTAGIVGPLIVAWLAWRILRYRNTQAATGVLFVGVILTFIGEMTALLLYRELAIPL